MLGSKPLVLRRLLPVAAICCVSASCGPDVQVQVLDERRQARVMSREAPRGTDVAASDRARPAPAPAVSADPVADSMAPGVRGRVTVGGVGLGAVGVRLETAEGETLEAASHGGRTDERGFFGFEFVPAGIHRLSLDLPESSGVVFPDTSRTVRVGAAATVVRADFGGRLQLASGIRGVVRDRDGEPLAGVRVRAAGHALEGYATDLHPSLASLTWADTAVTGPDGRYSLAVPAGWYRVSVWRDEWLETARFLSIQYRSPLPAVAPGDTATEDFHLRTFETAECVVDRLRYGDRIEREPGAMRCGEPLHPAVTRFEIWAFEGEAGDGIRVSADLAPGSPLLVIGPEGDILARDAGPGPAIASVGGEGAGPEGRSVAAILERSGTHRIVVTYAGPVSSTADSYRLRLSGPGGES